MKCATRFDSGYIISLKVMDGWGTNGHAIGDSSICALRKL